MFVAWTTLESREIAEQLATEAIAKRLAACAHVDSHPHLSIYHWEGKVEMTPEYRVTFKFLPDQLAALETWVHQRHPYDVPEWIVVRAAHVGEKYLSWAKANSTFTSL
jgi:periplasmic divalent cation tolerance protein